MLRSLFAHIFRGWPGIGRRALASSRHGSDARIRELLRAGFEHRNSGRHAAARESFEEILALDPENVDALHLLGHLLSLQGRPSEAIPLLERAVKLQPGSAEIHFNLGNAYETQGLLNEALASLENALRLRPGFGAALNNLANIAKKLGMTDRAEACYRELTRLEPATARHFSDLGNNLLEQGRLDEAIACYQAALDVDPGFVGAHSNLLFAMNCHPGYSPEQIANEHRRWGERHGRQLASALPPPVSDRTPHRRLRVGYVSPDFRNHPVFYLFEPVLRHHDPAQVDVYCYSDVARPDEYTRHLHGLCTNWRDVAGWPDDELARTIRRDRIDILVDLAGHTNDNRLLVFARKAAPIQITWIGYPNTTGLEAMDYRLTDSYADPPGATEHLHTERLLRLPQIYVAFRPAEESPLPGPLPAVANRYVTFGSFNALSRVTPQMLELWSGILQRLPDSRLVMVSVPEGKTRTRLTELFAARGIATTRLDLFGRVPFSRFLSLLQQVDIALDSFPYHGTSTTCHTLWMGVPLITLAGRNHASRVGVSMLSNLGLGRLIARTPEEYCGIALALAGDRDELARLRSQLRGMMANAPNTDGAALTRGLEHIYRKVWVEWCAGWQPETAGP
jgi:protein O-GlcNAc transferase